ncbi:MAG: penicillin-binding protein activator LpoB [Burkholderiaceae bacterium]
MFIASNRKSNITGRLVSVWLVLVLCLFVNACTTVNVQSMPEGLKANAQWALLPMVNHTQTPQAGLRAEAILESLVRTRGVTKLQKYPSALNAESLFEPVERSAVEEALKWARDEQAVYALTGTVDEWRYKVGVDGEPAVGITLQLIELQTGNVLWSATGSKTGWSREALSAVAQKLISRLTAPISRSAFTAGSGE